MNPGTKDAYDLMDDHWIALGEAGPVSPARVAAELARTEVQRRLDAHEKRRRS